MGGQKLKMLFHVHPAVVPCFKDPVWMATEINSGDEDVRVEDDLQDRLRALRMVFLISEGRKPDLFASLRASAINASKVSRSGSVIVLSMRTSSLPMTTNCDPVLRLSCFRILSGMTTCPLDDIFVVATSAIPPPVCAILLVRLYARKDRRARKMRAFGVVVPPGASPAFVYEGVLNVPFVQLMLTSFLCGMAFLPLRGYYFSRQEK